MTARSDPSAGDRPAIQLKITRRSIALAALLVLGLVVRLWATRWPPFPFDMNTWIAWAERLRDVGPSGFYAEGYFADYTPGYLYVLWLIGAVKHAFFASAGIDTYYFLNRLPALICDLVIAVIIFRLVEQAASRIDRRDAASDAGDTWPWLPATVAALWLFNPAVIFNSAVWGQVDATFTLAMLLALVFLLDGRPEAAIVSYAVALLLKPHAITIAPVVGLALVFWFPPARVGRALAAGLIAGIVLLLPFFGLRFIPGLWDQLTGSTQNYAFTSLFSYNLWGIYGFWQDDRLTLFGPISARGFGVGLFVLGLVYGGALLWQELRRGSDRAFTLFLFSSYFALMPVMVLTMMHERYLYPLLPFLLIFAALCHLRSVAEPERAGVSRFLLVPLILYLAFTVLHTMNLYQVYQYYLNFNSGGPPATDRLYYRIADNAKVWSALSLFGFWVFLILIPAWLEGGEERAAAAAESQSSREPLRRRASA